MNALTDFIHESLYPALFERIDEAFPSYEFRRKGGDWHSSHYLNGEPTSPCREDKTVVTRRYPTRALEQGGESLSLVSLYLQSTGHSPDAQGAELVEALTALCSLCNLTLPETDTEEYRAYKERQQRLARAASTMQRALFQEEGSATLRYLTEQRGYSLDEVKAMGLGYCSEAIAKDLEGAPYGAGRIYTLAIPYTSGGRILGFKLRAITPDTRDKYKNTEGLPKKANLFGLTGLRLTGNGQKDRDLTIVEGELDALRAQIRGVENVAASAGLDLSEEALLEAKRRGVRRVTLLVDLEETEAKQEAKQPKIRKAIETVAKAGLVPLVAVLPEGTQGEKVDTDSFLSSHSVEDFQKVVDGASTGALYLFLQIKDRARRRQGEEPSITEKAYDDYKAETIALLGEDFVNPVDADRITTLFANSTPGAGITKEAIQAEAEAKKRRADADRQAKRTKELLEKASKLADNGQIEDCLRLLQEEAPEASKIAKEAGYASLLSTLTAEEIRARLQVRPKGVKTDYVFSKGGRSERLILPAGALTLVAAPTSHGKSTFLRNLALQTAGNQEEGTVLYFSFEEDTESTVVELVNTFAGVELTSPTRDYNNLSTIAEYYREGSTRYMKDSQRETFLRKEAEFMKGYIESGRLRIFDFDYTSNELIEAVEYIARRLKVKAVFVDYVQLLYRQGNRLQRNEELKEIAKELRQTAKSLKVPIILAAQLNRDAKSPTEMHSQNIADSADLEREANKVLLLWNTAFAPTNGNAYDERKIESSKKPELGKPGNIYARLSKNRGGLPAIDALLDFNGNTGVIATNYEPEEEEAEQQDLPF